MNCLEQHRQKIEIRNASANIILTKMRLCKAQLFKITQSRGFLGALLGNQPVY